MKRGKPGPKAEDKTSAIVIYVVGAGWFTSVIADMFVPGYEPPQMVNAAMLAVIGVILARWRLKAAEGEGKEGEAPAAEETAPEEPTKSPKP
jgi:hypothetical protein